MTYTALTPIIAPGAPGGSGVQTNTVTAATFTAVDATNFNSVISTGKELVLVKNTDSSTHPFTIKSAPDGLGRTGDISAVTIPDTSGATSANITMFGPFPTNGWQQSDLTLHLGIASENADLAICVIVVP